MSADAAPATVPDLTVAAGSALVPPRRSWQYGIAPHYIGMFLWVGFSDRLARSTLAVGGLGLSMIGFVIGGLLCNVLLFQGPALWGKGADKTTFELAPRVFGKRGARWAGAIMGLAQIVWFAVGVAVAAEWTLDGLVALGFLDEKIHAPTTVGSLVLPNKLFLVTSLFWCFAVGLTATWLVRVIGAIMNAYPIFPALALAAVVAVMLGGLPRFAPTGIDPWIGRAVSTEQGALLAITRAIALVMGFFATAGVLSADWGKGSETERDVVIGGWVGVSLASIVIASLGLMACAGYQGRVAPATLEAPEPGVIRASGSTILDLSPPSPPELTLHAAIASGIGGRLGGGILLILGLGSLAPAVYASFQYAHRFKEAIGGISRIAWMLVATAAAWPLIALGATRDLERIFLIMGAVFAPMAATYSAIARHDRREWTGARTGINPAAAIGWFVGLFVGLIPFLPIEGASRFQPAVLWSFVAAWATTRALASLGLETPAENPEPSASESRDHEPRS
ncbi:MAG: hypothetical protein SFX72_04835 [Isosphaeraceae bacterium]|nr:hypothetical protein [Isosphaeraceae bacterium]